MARIIEFEGRRIELPDDATDAEVQQALNPGFASLPAPNGVPRVMVTPQKPYVPDPTDQNPPGGYPAPPPAPTPFGRGVGLGTQAVGAGMADVAGAPVDIMTGALNLGAKAINKIGDFLGYSPDIQPIQHPFLGSDYIRDSASKGAAAAGVPVVDPKDMSSKEKLLYDVERFGTQALATAGPLAVAAPARATSIAAGGARTGVGDAFLRPYMDNPARTVAGDVAAGVGAGAATNAADTYLPDKKPDTPWTNAAVDAARGIAPIVGGVAGATAASMGEGAGRMVKDAFTKGRPDKNIPLDPANPSAAPATKGEIEKASRIMQDVASNPEVAARNIRESADANKKAGLPQPTVGLVSGDVGLQSAESAARTKNGVPFIENDNRLREAATDRVNSLRDPKADQGLVTAKAKATPGELAGARDAEALPLLRAAEARGAKVDAQPIVDLIDQKLATAKREPVVNALKNARDKLNAPGTDQLDTSVSGLYETRKAINDIIEGRTDNSTGRFAQKELIEVRDALDKQINAVAPEFGQYLTKFHEGSQPLNALEQNQSAQKLINGEDPRDVARRIFGSPSYGAAKELDGVKAITAKDPETQRAWKAAVSEYLSDAVSGTTKIDAGKAGASETSRVELSKLDKMFKDNRVLLAKVYAPEEMNTLQQAHAALEPLKNATVRATGGSNTVDKAEQVWRLAEAGLKAKYGVLKGGGIMRTMKLMASTLPDDSSAIQRIIERAWFDPDIAEYLLTNKVRNLDVNASNAHVRRLMGAAAYGRSSGEDQ